VALRRGVGLVLGLLVIAVLISAGGMALLWSVASREPTVARDSTLVLQLDTDLHESSPDDVMRQLFAGPAPASLGNVLETLRKAKVDPRVGAIVIAPSRLQAPLWGKVQEVRAAILDFRSSGKPAYAYLEYADDRGYYLATACSRILLMPSSQLSLNGLASYSVFLRGTFEKLDAFPDFLHVGQYKTAANQYTERGFTPADREMSESLNTDMYEQLVQGIATGRRKTEADVRALIDQGPFLAADALKAGLVDDLAYSDQIDDKLRLPGGSMRELNLRDYTRVSASSLGLNRGPKIALLQASGVIVSGTSGYDAMNGAVLGSDTFIKYIREARSDSSVRAIVLRIDSPGGSAIASDAIWRELVITRDEKPHRPLVVSMSDLAASGGYYMAMASPYIVAQPGTLTGSIGVVGGKIVTGGTFAKAGANIEVVSRGRHAEMESPTRPFNPEERAKVQKGMEDFYYRFVEHAARSRHMTVEKLHGIAQGRVWTGRQAKQVGLVDELGGLERALAVAKGRAGLSPNAEVQIVTYPPRRNVFELLGESLGSQSRTDAGLAAVLGGQERRMIGMLTAPSRLFDPGELLAVMPFSMFSR
jgi:protease IV